jgi:anti-sigma regulatory factor (Ser/Thr protein kinase)
VDTIETHLAGTAAAERAARTFVRSALEQWDVARSPDVAELLTAELVANVVVHAHSDVTVRACIEHDALRIEVDDDCFDLPHLEHPATDNEHGRGMLLIATLADRWGAERHRDGGKTVWFELNLRAS